MLIIDGSIIDYLFDKEDEIKDLSLTIEKQLKVHYAKPNSADFWENVRYNYMIRNMVEEYVNDEIYSCI